MQNNVHMSVLIICLERDAFCNLK